VEPGPPGAEAIEAVHRNVIGGRRLGCVDGRLEAAYAAVVDDFERRARRMDRTRFLIRAELAIAFAAPVIAGFLFIAAPGCFCPMFPDPPWYGRLLPWAGALGVIVGLVAMARLSRINPEPGDRTWRYRDY